MFSSHHSNCSFFLPLFSTVASDVVDVAADEDVDAKLEKLVAKDTRVARAASVVASAERDERVASPGEGAQGSPR